MLLTATREGKTTLNQNNRSINMAIRPNKAVIKVLRHAESKYGLNFVQFLPTFLPEFLTVFYETPSFCGKYNYRFEIFLLKLLIEIIHIQIKMITLDHSEMGVQDSIPQCTIPLQ